MIEKLELYYGEFQVSAPQSVRIMSFNTLVLASKEIIFVVRFLLRGKTGKV